ncbi:MAG: hypothetical protein M5U01_29890 [Ardenticatenaceae bacterium]|nr:hypothetical protein [Ardenticatenaceae bacterium]
MATIAAVAPGARALVKRYREGEHNEGGSGLTTVELMGANE